MVFLIFFRAIIECLVSCLCWTREVYPAFCPKTLLLISDKELTVQKCCPLYMACTLYQLFVVEVTLVILKTI